MKNYKIWTKWYGMVGDGVSFPTRDLAYDFLVDYIGTQEEVEEMFEEGLASIYQETDDV